MIGSIRDSIRGLAEGVPGRCFWDAYHRDGRHRGAGVWTVLAAVVGLLCVVAGLLMLALPGPGVAFLLLGLMILGGESLFVSRFLDKAEMWLRRVHWELKRFWKGASPTTRAVVGWVVLTAVAVLCYTALYTIFVTPKG